MSLKYNWKNKILSKITIKKNLAKIQISVLGLTSLTSDASLECSFFLYLAETVVVNVAQSFENVNGVCPVISSNCAGCVPPVILHNKRSV